ncbi:SurA N-terminal domain-containing protein [Sphingomonas canadensis]|uniref:Parvulin-like PPIase n=1 Tax=Sphingomonas canadensis TaxID=1219257 RepID=A0ABW3HCA9_9SPHN|nr:peptidylprolyl isomerase [Sphingomonas canadensis]MCW3837746.1 SurA N-terminal domain-containing protein [Sphingomonas canadensis]
MLNAFRNFTKSKVGMAVVFLVLVLIAVAFAAGDITGIGGNRASSPSKAIAKIGDREITAADLRQRIDDILDRARKSGQAMTMQELVANGGVEYALRDAALSAAAEEYARLHGVTVSSRYIDSEIANTPEFRAVDGKFDQKRFEAALAGVNLTPARYRGQLSEASYVAWILRRDLRQPYVPDGLVNSYATLGLERRFGAAALVRRTDMDPGPDPDDKALTAFYSANKARYSIPERRVLSYALVRADQFKAQSAPTEAEIADAYKRSGNRYAAAEKRTVRQLVLLDQASATAAANEAKGGKTLEAVAQERKLETASFASLEKAELAAQTSQAVADAAFGAAEGAVAGPVRGKVGWAVVRVEKVEKIPAKSLDEARAELTAELAKTKEINALANLRQSIEDGIGDGRTFAELIRDTKLTPARTASLTAGGVNPDDPASKPDPALAEIIRGGFAAAADEREPQLVPVGAEGGFAIVAIEGVTPATARPLATVREKVLADYRADQQLKKARAIADEIVKKIAAGTPFERAVVEGGANRIPAEKFQARRSELRPDVPPQVRAVFQLVAGKARAVPAQDGSGVFVSYLEKIEQTDISKEGQLLAQIRNGLGQQVTQERAMQFFDAIKKELKYSENKQALDAFKASLLAGPGGN